MKVSMVSEHASPLAALGGVDAGGQNVHVAALSAALAAAGHDVVVYTRRDGTEHADVVDVDGYQVRHVPAGPATVLPKDELLPYMADFGRWLEDDWRRERPDVVHAHFWMSGIAAHVGARALALPVVQTFHALGIVKHRFQGRADTSPPARIRLERSLASSAARVVATATDEVFELLRMGVRREQTVVVPCGVDLDRFHPYGPSRSAELDRLQVLSVGRLVPRKGIDILLRALVRARNAQLTVAGGPPRELLDSDPEAQRLLSLARELGVADRVSFLGSLPHADLPALYRSVDVVACTPWYEPFGIVPLEAMACGKPVLATAVGGLVDTVVDGVTGVLVRPRRPDEVASALLRSAQDRPWLAAMGQAAADRARTRYSWERIAEETLRVYRSVLDRQTLEAAAR
jgi:D-inositol-3-phosphate glycosyltransferase